MSKILVIGSLNMDMVINTTKIPKIGETVIGNGFLTVPGGKGANQAVAASKLGGQVTMIGCVGNDVFGSELIANLNRNKVNAENIRVIEEISTGIAVITVFKGNNSIIIEPGANYRLTPQMVVDMENLIKDCSFVVLQLEIPIETIETVINMATKHNRRIVLNPAPAILISEELISKVDILVLNESESETITGIKVTCVEDAKGVIIKLNEMGAKQVIVTMGENGAVYNRGNEIINAKAPHVKTVDTTAAGDAFIGAVVVAISQGKNIDEAVYYANMVGALTVTKKGAQTSLPCKEDVERFISGSVTSV